MPSINEMQAQITRLDTYTQLSVLGAWSFIANAACINQAMRFVPDEPVDNGIECFTQYEAARRSLIAEADTSVVPALIALQRDITGMIYEADGQGRGIEDTFRFLTEKAPKRADFEAEFDNRVRAGLKPAMTKRQFADYEFERAMASHNALVAKGEHAVRLCETITISDDRGYNDLPDWVSESFMRKLVEKLHSRWEKLELVRTNPRRAKQIRDAAAGDQLMIQKVLAEYGEVPGFTSDDDIPDASDVQTMREESFKSLADMPNDLDATAPGPVTITKFVRVPSAA